MHSFLIASKNKDEASNYTSKLLIERGIQLIDIRINNYEKAMGIEDVRNIQKSILLKPFRGKEKAVIIEIHEGATLEAQNSLLKLLEEPPNNTIIVITAPNKDLFLPTILSRCKIIVLREENIKLIETDLSELEKTLNVLLTEKIGDKLKLAQDIAKDKKDAILWLEKMAVFVKSKLTQDNKNLKFLNFLKELQKTYKTIKNTNITARTALENLFLSS